MQLTRYTDYALRVLMYLGTSDDRLASIHEIAIVYNISQNHLMKVVHDLGKKGYVETLRGRNGGLRLAKKPSEINIGQVIRETEDNFQLVKCSSCIIITKCTLISALDLALHAFLEVLDRYTLADILAEPEGLKKIFSHSIQVTGLKQRKTLSEAKAEA
ncbi:Rrf2 family transcriptional regulator [Entomobacter blattae]|uniref:HTH-type transcriptional repressor NsrR n=1 Tax=Entomobacter blattae TaxID=2762277 RepID=A0A7H1NUT7_9PROT|nr:Rrf2 family transcriptional regulator [Entomobacter blattae]QNT79547.1 HTH-type transcriptional repressor NsrR [Entomobacter blattae]